MKKIVLFAQVLSMLAAINRVGFADPARLTIGPIAVQYDAGSGLSVWYNGVPVLVGSGVQAYAPGWKEGYYSSYYGATPSVSASGNQITVVFHSSRYGFSGAETYQLQGQTLNMQLHVTWTNSKPALMELNLGLIWSPSFIGLPIQVQGSQAAAEKVTPVITRSTINNPDRLAGNFSELSLTGRVCNFTLTSPDASNGSVLLDGRHTQRGWSNNSPNFWLGMLGVPLPQNQTVHFAATFSFTPGAAAQSPSPPVSLTLSPSERPIYRLPEHPVIIPKPKQLLWLKEPLIFNHPQAVTCELDGPAQDTMPALHSLRRWLKRLAGIKLIPSDLNPTVQLRLKRSAGHGHPEGYDLSVNEHQAVITGHDAAGIYYGAQTLIELLTSKEDMPALAGCHISDWPTFPFRGAHLFVGSDARPFEDRLIQRVLSHLKMNQLVLECEYTKWTADPKIWTSFSMSKSDLAAEVTYARAHYMDPIPLIETLGHSEWIFQNGQNRQWAEEKTNPHDYSPTAPGIYHFVHQIYSEAIQIFQPKIFHIGHDEINIFGKYPVRAADIKLGTTRIFNDDVHKISGWLASKGIQTMLWGDMMLDRQEVKDGAANANSLADATLSRKLLTPGAIVADWHYGGDPPKSFNSLKLFRKDHIPTVASTWYNPLNIRNFAQAARKQHCLGLLQTCWAGYNISEQTLKDATNQFTAYVLAADYAWSGRKRMPNDLPYDPSNVLRRLWNAEPLRIVPISGRLVQLSAAAEPKLGHPAEIVSGGWNLGKVAGRLDFNGALSNRSAPVRASLNVNGQIRGIVLVGACRYPVPKGTPILSVEVHYVDGQVATSVLRYGQEINAMSVHEPLLGADIVPAGRFNQSRRYWSLWHWSNPNPLLDVTEVDLICRHPYAQPFITDLAIYE